jgi:AraC-like DNA-binding protein
MSDKAFHASGEYLRRQTLSSGCYSSTGLTMKLTIKSAAPDASIAHFVQGFWMLGNKTGKDIPIVVLPDGMVDLFVYKTGERDYQVMIRGIDTMPGDEVIAASTKMFAISFKLLAVEYLFGDSIKDVLNKGKIITGDLWQFDERSLSNFKRFCDKATQKIKSIPVNDLDNRKRNLFNLIYASHGARSVNELSEKVFWSSRQVNRYFNQQFGISLKTYCNILRFRASFNHISEGKLFPEQKFTDQNHFIKEIKKYSGVTPKVLSRNKDEKFINITALKKSN